ncbi:hypothetical protein ABW19_dt0210582 [Dactylella cylindrospora]|nr:hypothetical protein ABW19_dt0210582 [Dactylella cylindrospora]
MMLSNFPSGGKWSVLLAALLLSPQTTYTAPASAKEPATAVGSAPEPLPDLLPEAPTPAGGADGPTPDLLPRAVTIGSAPEPHSDLLPEPPTVVGSAPEPVADLLPEPVPNLLPRAVTAASSAPESVPDSLPELPLVVGSASEPVPNLLPRTIENSGIEDVESGDSPSKEENDSVIEQGDLIKRQTPRFMSQSAPARLQSGSGNSKPANTQDEKEVIAGATENLKDAADAAANQLQDIADNAVDNAANEQKNGIDNPAFSNDMERKAQQPQAMIPQPAAGGSGPSDNDMERGAQQPQAMIPPSTTGNSNPNFVWPTFKPQKDAAETNTGNSWAPPKESQAPAANGGSAGTSSQQNPANADQPIPSADDTLRNAQEPERVVPPVESGDGSQNAEVAPQADANAQSNQDQEGPLIPAWSDLAQDNYPFTDDTQRDAQEPERIIPAWSDLAQDDPYGYSNYPTQDTGDSSDPIIPWWSPLAQDNTYDSNTPNDNASNDQIIPGWSELAQDDPYGYNNAPSSQGADDQLIPGWSDLAQDYNSPFTDDTTRNAQEPENMLDRLRTADTSEPIGLETSQEPLAYIQNGGDTGSDNTATSDSTPTDNQIPDDIFNLPKPGVDVRNGGSSVFLDSPTGEYTPSDGNTPVSESIREDSFNLPQPGVDVSEGGSSVFSNTPDEPIVGPNGGVVDDTQPVQEQWRPQGGPSSEYPDYLSDPYAGSGSSAPSADLDLLNGDGTSAPQDNAPGYPDYLSDPTAGRGSAVPSIPTEVSLPNGGTLRFKCLPTFVDGFGNEQEATAEQIQALNSLVSTSGNFPSPYPFRNSNTGTGTSDPTDLDAFLQQVVSEGGDNIRSASLVNPDTVLVNTDSNPDAEALRTQADGGFQVTAEDTDNRNGFDRLTMQKGRTAYQIDNPSGFPTDQLIETHTPGGFLNFGLTNPEADVEIKHLQPDYQVSA